MAQERLFKVAALPPSALTVAAAWVEGSGWRVTVSAAFAGQDGWVTSRLDGGSPMTRDELVTLVATMLDALLADG